jgi:uncharacterized protein
MLKANLAGLDREEARLVESVPVDAPFWNGTALHPAGPLEVDLVVRSVGDGVLVRGRLNAEVELECRRCLSPVRHRVDDTVDMYFSEIGDDEAEIEGEVYPLSARAVELDLTDAVREQLVLRVPEFALCREACRGLCPKCGTNLNETECDCVPEAPPSPWDALKQAKLD